MGLIMPSSLPPFEDEILEEETLPPFMGVTMTPEENGRFSGWDDDRGAEFDVCPEAEGMLEIKRKTIFLRCHNFDQTSFNFFIYDNLNLFFLYI